MYETERSTGGGIAPFSLSRPNHQRASAMPGRQPAAPASGATRRVSVAMERRIWRGVVPMARSRANARARWPTERATVPAAVNAATVAAIPPKDPPSPVRSSLAPASEPSSAAPRSSPVWTSALAPSAWATWALRVPSATPDLGSTAMASMRPGCPETRTASESASQAVGCGCVAVVPETR